MPEKAVPAPPGEQRSADTLADYVSSLVALPVTPTISVVVPRENEARNLGNVFASIQSWVDEIALMDGHSTDRPMVVRSPGLSERSFQVPTLPKGRGSRPAATAKTLQLFDAGRRRFRPAASGNRVLQR
jgi:hypothetical protein